MRVEKREIEFKEGKNLFNCVAHGMHNIITAPIAIDDVVQPFIMIIIIIVRLLYTMARGTTRFMYIHIYIYVRCMIHDPENNITAIMLWSSSVG